MRFLLGFILGIVVTVVAAFVLDRGAERETQRMVNWEVVNERLGALTAEAREVWADFTREITGPQ